MAVLKLEIEDNEVHDLLGLSSAWQEHRLVWAINRALNIKLLRKKDFHLNVDSKEEGQTLFQQKEDYYYPLFNFSTDAERITLVSNFDQGKVLYDKSSMFDYLIQIESTLRDQDDVLERLKKLDAIAAIGSVEFSTQDLTTGPFNEFI